MDWTAKIDSRQNVLLLTFYMFIAMTLMVIRAGVVARGVSDVALFTSKEDEATASFVSQPPDGEPPTLSAPPPSSLNDYLDRLYADALALLYAAELIARQLAVLSRQIYELMGQAHALAEYLRGDSCKAGGRRNLLGSRLDAP